MKIPQLPQVLFDEFPSDDNTKICIFTQPQYPIPDLNSYVGKTSLVCTEVTTYFMAAFSKKLPFKLFQLLPNEEKHWMKFEKLHFTGLDTPFALACLPTGSVIGSVMLLIFVLDKPDELILYTGRFKECRSILMSDMLLKYKNKVNEMYLDNTMASSLHFDIEENNRTSDEIKAIIDKFPNHIFHLQMNTFDSMDLLVELARRHRLNVKLSELQQVFFYRTQYRHLFELDAKLLIARSKHLNQNFQFKDRPKVYIKSIKTYDLATYKRLFQKEKIINIRLIPRTQGSSSNFHEDGLFYVKYVSHAGSYTLAAMFETVQPKRVYPMVVDYLTNGDSYSKIPNEILNEDCKVIDGSDAAQDTVLQRPIEHELSVIIDPPVSDIPIIDLSIVDLPNDVPIDLPVIDLPVVDLPDVTLEDINPNIEKNHSFLSESTLLMESSLGESWTELIEGLPNLSIPNGIEAVLKSSKNVHTSAKTVEMNIQNNDEIVIIGDESDEAVVISSDSDSDVPSSASNAKRRKTFTSFCRNSKTLKTNNLNAVPNACSTLMEQLEQNDSDSGSFSSVSDYIFQFPD